jgi:hypothetical protein
MPPPDEGAEHSAYYESRDTGARARRAERAQGGGLLNAMVILRDQRDQRRNERRAGQAAQQLRGQHQIRR